MADKLKFGKIRIETFNLWKEYTGRSGRGYNESIADTYECDWQLKADEKFSKHISVFCSLGEWASNISDILKDKSLHDLDFFTNNHRQPLYRYYTRLLLVVSEMLVDFQNIYEESDKKAIGTKARKFYSTDSNKKEIDNLFGYINNVCKHKTRSIHTCNHHLNIWFEDTGRPSRRKEQIKIGNTKFDKTKKPVIIVPPLSYIISVLINCYEQLNELFETNESDFDRLCIKYKEI